MAGLGTIMRGILDTHVRYRTISDNLEEQKIYIFTDNYLDNQRSTNVLSARKMLRDCLL